MRGVRVLRPILGHAAALPPALGPFSVGSYTPGFIILEQVLARAGIDNRRLHRYFGSDVVEEVSTSAEARSSQSHLNVSGTGQDASRSLAGISTQCDTRRDWAWCFRRVPGSHTVWEHEDPENRNRISARGSLFGENLQVAFTKKAESSWISGIAKLFQDMRMKGWAFYEPLTVDMFVVDTNGKLHIADGVILQLCTQRDLARDWTWCFRRLPGSHTIWKHEDPANKNRISARTYVQLCNPISSVYLLGDNWKTEVTNRTGTTLISGFAELFDDMRLKGWSFYDPVNANMFVVDDRGKVHIADGTALRVCTQFSHSLDILLGADCLEDLLFSWSHIPLRYPAEVIDFLLLMRSPKLQPEYMMLIHPAGVLEHLRGPLYMRYFDFVIHGQKLDSEDQVMLFGIMKSCGLSKLGSPAELNMLMNMYMGSNQFKEGDLREKMYLRRIGECHVLGYLRTCKKFGFEYTRKEQQLLLHAKCGLFCCLIQRFLFSLLEAMRGGRVMLRELRTEEFFCQIGFCCPLGECKRMKCFDREVSRRWPDDSTEIAAIMHAANMIRSHSANAYILKWSEELCELSKSSYCKPLMQPEFSVITHDFEAKEEGALTVNAGDVVQLLFEPCHHHPYRRSLYTRHCYVRNSMGQEGFVRIKFLHKYSSLFHEECHPCPAQPAAAHGP